MQLNTSFEIPLKSNNEVIVLDIDENLDAQEVLAILTHESAPIEVWVNVALVFYRLKRHEDFQNMLDNCVKLYIGPSGGTGGTSESILVKPLDLLAIYYVQKGNKCRGDKEEMSKLMGRATRYMSLGDKIAMFDGEHLVRRAFFFLYEQQQQQEARFRLTIS